MASPSCIKAHGRPRHPNDVEGCDCINFYDAATARPYGWEVRRILELGCRQLLDSGRLIELFPEWSDERYPLYAIHPPRLHRSPRNAVPLSQDGASQAVPVVMGGGPYANADR